MKNPILLGSILAVESLIKIKEKQIEIKNINSYDMYHHKDPKVHCYIKGELFQLNYALDLLKKLEHDLDKKLSEL